MTYQQAFEVAVLAYGDLLTLGHRYNPKAIHEAALKAANISNRNEQIECMISVFGDHEMVRLNENWDGSIA